MKKAYRILAAQLLETASERFTNHGCNDFDPRCDPQDWLDFVKAYHDWNGDPEEFDPSQPHLPDWAVMSFLAKLILDDNDSPTLS